MVSDHGKGASLLWIFTWSKDLHKGERQALEENWRKAINERCISQQAVTFCCAPSTLGSILSQTQCCSWGQGLMFIKDAFNISFFLLQASLWRPRVVILGLVYLTNTLVMPWEVSPALRTQIAIYSDQSGRGLGNGGFPSTEGESVQSIN